MNLQEEEGSPVGLPQQIAGFFRFGAGLWIFGDYSGISGVRRRSGQGSGEACALEWANADRRKMNIYI
jgi:hypothetical protein